MALEVSLEFAIALLKEGIAKENKMPAMVTAIISSINVKPDMDFKFAENLVLKKVFEVDLKDFAFIKFNIVDTCCIDHCMVKGYSIIV